MAGKLGVHSQQPENAALERELRCLYGTRCGDLRPLVAAGAAGSHRAHAPAGAGGRQPLPDRTRGPTACRPVKGSRAGAGQPLGRVTRDQEH